MIQTYCMQSQVFNLSMFIIILIEICEYICQKWVKNRTSFGIKFLFPKIQYCDADRLVLGMHMAPSLLLLCFVYLF